MTDTCRSCPAPVFWAETTAGRRMLVDAEPVPDGNVIVDEVRHPGTSLERTVVRVLRNADTVSPDRLRYRAHFATCPAADHHRRRR